MAEKRTPLERLQQAPRERLQQVLLDSLRKHRFPSPGMLELTERSLTESGYEAYLSALIDKIEEAQYPSPELVRRALDLVGG